MDRTQKKNTVGFDFGRSGVMPTLKEAISFLVRDLGIKDSEVHSIYLDVSDKTFFVKFIDEVTLKETTQRQKKPRTSRTRMAGSCRYTWQLRTDFSATFGFLTSHRR